MNRNAEQSFETSNVEPTDLEQRVESNEARALTVAEMDVVGGGSVVDWLL